MEKSCDTCVKKDTCRKVVGTIFGVCNVEYEPLQTRIKAIDESKVTCRNCGRLCYRTVDKDGCDVYKCPSCELEFDHTNHSELYEVKEAE